MIWVAFTVLIGVTLAWMLAPLLRAAPPGSGQETALAWYHARCAALRQDYAAGELPQGDLQAALALEARRLLQAQNTARDAQISAPVYRKAAALVLFGVPVLAVALYLRLGAPTLPDAPLEPRMVAELARAQRNPAPRKNQEQQDIENMRAETNPLIQKVEAHLQKNPDDARGWEVIVPVYMRIGRFAEAAEAYRRLLALRGENAERQTDLAEALISQENGRINAEARSALERALVLDPGYDKAQFYAAFMQEQTGNVQGALEMLKTLRARIQSQPHQSLIDEQIARIEGRPPPATPAAPPPLKGIVPRAAKPEAALERGQPPAEAPVSPAQIRAMVEGLQARLDAQGGSFAEWERLIRAWGVLGEKTQAQAALAKARGIFAQQQEALQRLDALQAETASSP